MTTHLRSTRRPGLRPAESGVLAWAECGQQFYTSMIREQSCTCGECAINFVRNTLADED